MSAGRGPRPAPRRDCLIGSAPLGICSLLRLVGSNRRILRNSADLISASVRGTARESIIAPWRARSGLRCWLPQMNCCTYRKLLMEF